MPSRKSYPFWIVLTIEFALTLYLILGHRGVIGHDAFQYFTLQYYFLNNSAGAGETAQWLPFVSHGTVANWWFGVQAGIIQSAMLAFGPLNSLFVGWNFLPIYYFGILFDTGVFLLGILLLGRRYFSSNLTVLFVAVTAVGSATPFTQPWYNLHFFFALPLIFHFLHRLFETGKWRYFLFAGNLFAVQCNGSLPYLAPFSSLVVSAYASFYVLFFWGKARGELARLLWHWKAAILPLVIVLASFYFMNGMLTTGTESIANYNPGRALDGRNLSLEHFLFYGTNTNYRWAELLSRVSPAWDYSLYIGYFPLALALLGIKKKRDPVFLMLACTTAVVFLFSCSSLLASFFYYVWPGMQFFRHLGLASTIVRTLLCFIAGFGFERIFVEMSSNQVEIGCRARIRLAMIVLAGIAAYLMAFSRSFEYARALVFLSVVGLLPLDPRVFGEGYLPNQLFQASMWCLSTAALFGLLLTGRLRKEWIVIAAIAFQTLDVYSFKLNLAIFRTIPLTEEQYEVTRFQAVPYSTHRALVDYTVHARGKNVPQNTYTTGIVYSTQDLMMFTDAPSNIGRTDHWLSSLDDFLRTFSGEPIRNQQQKPKVFKAYEPFEFPMHKNALKLAGVTEPKIQFFSRAHFVQSDQSLSEMMASEAFSGDVLLLSGRKSSNLVPLEGNERVERDYKVVQYDSNNVKIRVSRAQAGEWLYYADCWHPFWSATINGEEAALHKANLAYKAVELSDGENIVHFRFHSPKLGLFLAVLNWNGLLWVVGILYFLWRGITEDDEAVAQ